MPFLIFLISIILDVLKCVAFMKKLYGIQEYAASQIDRRRRKQDGQARMDGWGSSCSHVVCPCRDVKQRRERICSRVGRSRSHSAYAVKPRESRFLRFMRNRRRPCVRRPLQGERVKQTEMNWPSPRIQIHRAAWQRALFPQHCARPELLFASARKGNDKTCFKYEITSRDARKCSNIVNVCQTHAARIYLNL